MEGTLFYGDMELGSAMFLVDTGADSTLLDPAKIRLTKSLYTAGKHHNIGGVGGVWPARKFGPGWSLQVLVSDNGTQAVTRLPFPMMTVLSPWGKRIRADKVEEVFQALPTSRDVVAGVTSRCPLPESLLGRDLFKANRLALHYDPHGESYIDLLSTQVAAAPAIGAPTYAKSQD